MNLFLFYELYSHKFVLSVCTYPCLSDQSTSVKYQLCFHRQQQFDARILLACSKLHLYFGWKISSNMNDKLYSICRWFLFFVPGSVGLSQIASNFFTLEVGLQPKQIHSMIKKLEAAQSFRSHPPI